MKADISWKLISEAINWYSKEPFEYLEVPWVAPVKHLMATAPGPLYISEASGIGLLVGSAEQSILHLRETEQIQSGKYVACTPCFRPKDLPDKIHNQYFMKVELWDDEDTSAESLEDLIQDAEFFFGNYLPRKDIIRKQLPNSIDLEYKGIEIGSYGRRSSLGLTWLYGTGLAEPRMSSIL